MAGAVIYDLEFTAWPGSMEHRWSRPGEFREVVQIGAVKLDADSFAQTGQFNALAKPRLNPVLSHYFEELTGVTNKALAEEGVDFADAYRAFVAFAEGMPMFSFGRDDLVLFDNIKLYGLQGVPPLPLSFNIVPWLIEQGIDPRGLHACDIANSAGAEFDGRRHDALDDARSVAAGVAFLVRRGAHNPLAGIAQAHA